MKKTITILIFALAAWACHHKTIPVADNNIIISNKTNRQAKKEITTTAGADVDLNAGGKTIYITRCNRCHALKKTEKFTQQQWNNILKSMIPKARLNDDEAKQVTTYVMANAKK